MKKSELSVGDIVDNGYRKSKVSHIDILRDDEVFVEEKCLLCSGCLTYDEFMDDFTICSSCQ